METIFQKLFIIYEKFKEEFISKSLITITNIILALVIN